MNLVACPRCGSQFDVSGFSPGAAFRCGTCENVLQVPALPVVPPVAPPTVAPVARPAAAAPSAAPVRPASRPAAKPAAAPEPARAAPAKKVDPRRAGSAPAQAAPAQGRAERIRQQRETAAPKSKNPVPLVIGLLVGLGLAGWGVSMAMKGGETPTKETDGTAATGTGGTTAATSDPTKTQGTVEERFDTLTESDRKAAVEAMVARAKRDAFAVQKGYEFLSSRGRTEDAQRVLDAGHGAFPDDPWICEKLGLENVADLLKAIVENEELMFSVESDDVTAIQEAHRKIKADPSSAWVRRDRAEALRGHIAAAEEEYRRLADPVYQRTVQVFNNVKFDPAFTGMEFSFEDARPYVIFIEQAGPDRKEQAERTAKLVGRALQCTYRNFLSFLRDELKMDAPRVEDHDDHRFKVFMFKSRESFDRWHARNKFDNPGPFVAAYYRPSGGQFIIMDADHGEVPTMIHEGTHQLKHYYTRHFCQKEDDRIAEEKKTPKEEVAWDDFRIRSAFFWLQEGIAEYFGNPKAIPGKEDDWTLFQVDRDHLNFFSAFKARGETWPVEDFLFSDQGQITSRSKVIARGIEPDVLKALMYAQGWTLVHYFVHGEDGRWKPKFYEFLRREMSGHSEPPDLLEAFGLGRKKSDPKVAEWLKEIEKGYLQYHADLVAGKVPPTVR